MDNLELMRARLGYQGGDQENRMIKDKYRTFLRALKYSYQAANIKNLNAPKKAPPCRALINPDKNKMDYDNKILSVDYAFHFKPGDIFYWCEKKTYWLVYLQEFTEDAYFRAEIRRCKYQLKWKDEEGEHSSYAYIRGPVETRIESIQKNGISVDVPNESLEIYIPYTESAKKFFQRYARFLFADKAWKVQTSDSISPEGIIQFIAVEDFVNPTLDNEKENIANDFSVEKVKVEEDDSEIIRGSDVMIPTSSETYKIETDEDVEWSIASPRSPAQIVPQGNNAVEVYWESMKSGSFELQAKIGDQIYKKIIMVESLF